MLFATLLNQIKREAELQASDDYDDMILDIVNELFSEAVRRTNLREYSKINQTLLLTPASQTTPLPSDWLRPAGNNRAYFVADGSTNRCLLRPAIARTMRDYSGAPAFFSYDLNQFNLFPYQNVVTGDAVILDYYAAVTAIASNGTLPFNFDVVCKHGTIARLLNQKDSKRAVQYQAEYQRALITLTANGASS